MDAVTGVTKTCFKCGDTKPIDEFHRHKEMKDGHLNKCASCTTQDTRAWRESVGKTENRRKRYERELETGARTRKRVIKVDGKFVGPDIHARRRASAKYQRKRAARVQGELSEATDFAYREAYDLCKIREAATGIEWEIDHIIPLNHKAVCGLHVANNFQVVPARWNYRKGNRNMDRYLGMGY